MLRVLALAAGLGLAAVTAVPAANAASLFCISLDSSCQSFSCPPDTRTVFNNGFTDTGPWVVICAPLI